MINAARARHSTTGTGTADDDVVPATLIHFAISTTAFPLLDCCSPLIFNRIQSERQIHHSSTQEFAHTLSKPVYDIATADAVLKDLIDNKMYRVKISEFAPLDSIVWLPVVYKQRNQHGSCQEGLKPGPGLGAPHPEADVGIATFVSRSGEDEVRGREMVGPKEVGVSVGE
jgi:hypothetical protein